MSFQPARTHRETYDAVFEFPAGPPPDRHDVERMLATFADVSWGAGGDVTFTRNGQVLVLRGTVSGGSGSGSGSDAEEAAELMSIRHFLQRAGANSMGAVPDGVHLMVVIGDRSARIYQVELDQRSTPVRVVPYDPHGFAGHFRSADDASRGFGPACRTFYEAVARTLRGAERVSIVLGSARGARGAVNELIAELRLRHPALAERVIGILAVDEQSPSEARLLLGVQESYRRHAR